MNPAAIRKRFEQIEKERKFSLRWISDSLGINRYSVKKLMRGDVRNDKDRERLSAIIKKLGYPEAEFFGEEELNRDPNDAGRIPLFGDIPAGNPLWLEGSTRAEEWVYPPPGLKHRKLFALRVRGNSMLPRFHSGDIIYMEPLSIKLGVKDPERPVPQLTFERLKGRVVAALVDGEATLKELQVVSLGKPDDYELRLMPLNADFSPIVVQANSTADFQGVVVGLYRSEP